MNPGHVSQIPDKMVMINNTFANFTFDQIVSHMM